MPTPHLLVKFNMAVIKDLPLDKAELTIGRKSENDLALDNQAVSGSHCKIKKEGEDYFINYSGSTNGTFLNGRKISREKLKNKDQIRIARYTAEFLTEDTPPLEITRNSSVQVEPIAADLPDVPTPPRPKAPAPAPIPEQLGTTLKGDRPLPPANGVLKIISGGEGRTEYRLTELMTYIGAGAHAMVKIKGFMAPELAAAISRRQEGYFLKAVKAGYPKVNGKSITDQVFLESGALIEVGSVNMVFYIEDPDKKSGGS